MRVLPTFETFYKNYSGENLEVLDQLYCDELIDSDQFHAGIRLRILRYKKFGKAGPNVRDYSHNGGREIIFDDYELNEQYQELFNESVRKLQKISAISIILDVCVHNIRPININQLTKLREGLDILADYYQSQKYHSNIPFSDNYSNPLI